MTWLLAKQYAYSNVLETVYVEDRVDELIPKISAILHENENTIKRLVETLLSMVFYSVLYQKCKEHLLTDIPLSMMDIRA